MKGATKLKLARLWNYPSAIGDRYNIGWLTYNPGVFFEFAMVAKRNAPLFAQALLDTFPDAHTFSDIGCGTGQYVKALGQMGKVAIGFERSRIARLYCRFIGVDAKPLDLTWPSPCCGGVFTDIALSLEVAEHIPTDLSKPFVETLANASRLVVLTAAQPGQGGNGHINCQPKAFWADLFLKLGWEKYVDKEREMSARLRTYPRLSPFLHNNLQIFHPIPGNELENEE